MKKIIFFLLLTCSAFAQEQLTNIKTLYGNDSSPVFAAKLNGKTFFTVYNIESVNSLWVTDSTEAGTKLIKDLVQYNNNYTGFRGVTKGNYLYFTLKNTGEVWRTDGTTVGTSKMLDKISELSAAASTTQSLLDMAILATENNFYIITQYQDYVFARKYDNDFKLLAIESSNSLSFPVTEPYLFKGKGEPQILVGSNIFFGDATQNAKNALSQTNFCYGCYLQLMNKFTINNKAYFDFGRITINAYETRGFIIEYDGTSTSYFYLPTNNNSTYRQKSINYFVADNQLYVASIGSYSEGISYKGLIEIYAYKPNVGFELKLSYSGDRTFDLVNNFWVEGQTLHFLAKVKENSNFAHYYYSIDYSPSNTNIKSKKVAEIDRDFPVIDNENGLFVFQKDYNNSPRSLYNALADKTFDLPSNVAFLNFFNEITPNKWLFNGTSVETGSEPYILDATNGKVSLLKDIKTAGFGVDWLNLLNNSIVWTSIQAEGVVLHSSDGTKDGTNPLKIITPQKQRLYSQNYLKTDNSLLANLSFDYVTACDFYNSNCELPVYYKPLTFTTDGSEKGTTKLYEKDSLMRVVSTKIGDSYYHLVQKKQDGEGVFKIVKTLINGKDSLIKAFKNSNTTIRSGNAVGSYFVVYAFNTYTYYYQDVIFAETGEVITNDKLKFFYYYNNKVYLQETISATEKNVYLLDGGNKPVKLFTSNSNLSPYNIYINGTIFFGDGKNVFVTNGTVKSTFKMPILFENAGIQYIKKFKDAYVLIFSKYDNVQNKTVYKWQISSDGTSQTVPFDSKVSVQYFDIPTDEALYFTGYGQNPTRTDYSIFRFDGKTVTQAGYLENDKYFTTEIVKDAIFLNVNNKIILWKPSGANVIGTGTLTNPVKYGNKYVFFTSETGFKNAKLYITDGTEAGTKVLKETFQQVVFPLIVLANKVYFSAYTPETGTEPWVTDGTPEGTKMLGDLYEGMQGSNPNYFNEVNGIPVCTASTPTGRQLFSLKEKKSAPGNNRLQAIEDVKPPEKQTLTAYPVPSKGMINLSFEPQNNTEIEVFDISGHRVFQQKNAEKIAEKSIDLSHLQKGIYYLKVNQETTRIVLE